MGRTPLGGLGPPRLSRPPLGLVGSTAAVQEAGGDRCMELVPHFERLPLCGESAPSVRVTAPS